MRTVSSSFLARPQLQTVLPRLQTVMNRLNGSLPAQLQNPWNPVNIARVYSYLAAGQGLPAAHRQQSPSPPLQQLQLQAYIQTLARAIQQQRQSQFLQNFAFNNTGRYHQNQLQYSDNRGHSKDNQEALCTNIKQEILRQLNVGPSVRGEQLSISEPDRDSTMSRDTTPKGTKRHAEAHHSQDTKRFRSQGENHGTMVQRNHAVPPSVRGNELDKMSNHIWQHFQQNRQTKEVYDRKMQLREALYAIVKGVFPYCGLYVVGSSMSGLGSKNSDMDLCLMLAQCEIDQKVEAFEVLKLLSNAFRRCTFLRDLVLIRARVPILKFRDKISGAECDLNINNRIGIRNTHLLNAYCKLDWRVAPLVVFVKYWAKSQNINDASQGTISSYSLVLMLLHYLQYGCDPPVLPSLQQKYPQKFSPNIDVRLLTLNEKLPDFESPNQDSLGELFIGFLNYYNTEFDFDRHAVSVRLGTRLTKDVAVRQSQNQGEWKCISIEEPFDRSNTTRAVRDQYVMQRIRRVFRHSYARVRQTGSLHYITTTPL